SLPVEEVVQAAGLLSREVKGEASPLIAGDIGDVEVRLIFAEGTSGITAGRVIRHIARLPLAPPLPRHTGPRQLASDIWLRIVVLRVEPCNVSVERVAVDVHRVRQIITLLRRLRKRPPVSSGKVIFK